VASFALARSKDTTSFSADADPNATPPPAADVVNISGNKSGRPAKDTQLHIGFFLGKVFVAGGNVTATIWVKDEATGLFIDTGKSLTTQAPLALVELGIVFDGPVFFRITAITDPGSTDTIQIFTKVV